MNIRSFIFWPHLIAAVLAGTIILIMCVTGVLLTYERQMIAWADSGFRSVKPTADAAPLPIDTLLARLRQSHPDLAPTSVTMRADADAAVTVSAGQRTLYLDGYTGRVVGEASRDGIRGFMSAVRGWHRWLAVDGAGRPLARALTGWSNALFLFIIASGIYLWFPRKWRWAQVRTVVLFNARARGKARDFNWHNVIGSWCSVPLFVVVLCAMPISFAWFTAAVYRSVGEEPPAPPAAAPPASERSSSAASAREARETQGSDERAVELHALWARAAAHVAGWESLSLRLPASRTAPVIVTLDRGNGGQPHLRSTLTLDPTTGRIVRDESFSDLTPGRRIRNTMRFAHTGEVLGIAGQTLAGIVSAGGAVLVWTGLALAWRRFRSWFRQRRRGDVERASARAA